MQTETTRIYEAECFCEECGETFWDSPGARCCSKACYSRRYRAKKAKSGAVSLMELCTEMLRRRDAGSEAYSKLLPRLFRQAAVELRRRGWNPFELLLSLPDEPSTPADTAPGGITITNGKRRRWLHAPEDELEILVTRIEQRTAAGKSVAWHRQRAALLVQLLEGGQ